MYVSGQACMRWWNVLSGGMSGSVLGLLISSPSFATSATSYHRLLLSYSEGNAGRISTRDLTLEVYRWKT